MPNNEKVIMTQEEYNTIEARLAELQQELNELRLIEASTAETNCYNAAANGEIQVRQNTINHYIDVLARAVIQEIKTDDNIVGLGDIVTVNITGPVNLVQLVKIVSTQAANESITIEINGQTHRVKPISSSSPIGAAIIEHQVGDSSSYTVNDVEFFVQIIEKLNQTREEGVTR